MQQPTSTNFFKLPDIATCSRMIHTPHAPLYRGLRIWTIDTNRCHLPGFTRDPGWAFAKWDEMSRVVLPFCRTQGGREGHFKPQSCNTYRKTRPQRRSLKEGFPQCLRRRCSATGKQKWLLTVSTCGKHRTRTIHWRQRRRQNPQPLFAWSPSFSFALPAALFWPGQTRIRFHFGDLQPPPVFRARNLQYITQIFASKLPTLSFSCKVSALLHSWTHT
jgi:hypothetical protein